MSEQVEKPINAGKPWTEDEIFLIATHTPSWHNAKFLAKQLGRTTHAVQYMWCKIYWSVKQLKEFAANDTETQQYQKILNARRRAGICIRCK